MLRLRILCAISFSRCRLSRTPATDPILLVEMVGRSATRRRRLGGSRIALPAMSFLWCRLGVSGIRAHDGLGTCFVVGTPSIVPTTLLDHLPKVTGQLPLQPLV